jgi:hypothetical protein
MNTVEAKAVLKERLQQYRQRSYEELAKLVGSVTTEEVRGPSGTAYQLEYQFCWDDKPQADIRVIGSIDDGRMRAFLPVTDDFIKSLSDQFVGE